MNQDEDFWESVICERYKPGQIVKARVTTITRFGILVEVEPGVEGVVHVTELAELPPRNIHDIVSIGEEIELKVLAVRLEAKRIGLSRKRVTW